MNLWSKDSSAFCSLKSIGAEISRALWVFYSLLLSFLILSALFFFLYCLPILLLFHSSITFKSRNSILSSNSFSHQHFTKMRIFLSLNLLHLFICSTFSTSLCRNLPENFIQSIQFSQKFFFLAGSTPMLLCIPFHSNLFQPLFLVLFCFALFRFVSCSSIFGWKKGRCDATRQLLSQARDALAWRTRNKLSKWEGRVLNQEKSPI